MWKILDFGTFPAASQETRCICIYIDIKLINRKKLTALTIVDSAKCGRGVLRAYIIRVIKMSILLSLDKPTSAPVTRMTVNRFDVRVSPSYGTNS
jgi:hypothetical protein